MKLVIGNKRLSSWSLRPWLVLQHFAIPFEEILIPLDQPQTDAEIARYSPGGKVPALVDGSLTVWDSLAICEYLNDLHPDRGLWPSSLRDRALARSVSAEMHSGFQVMRERMSHDLQLTQKSFVSHEAREDIERVKEIWTTCLQRSGGPFLFGSFSIADAMYAPVVNRFLSYAVPVDPASEPEVAAYLRSIRELPAHQKWIEAAVRETYETPLHP
jgi:glutathione S-transferase